MTRYVLNSPVLTNYGEWRFEGPISAEAATVWLKQAPFVSAVGHQATAAVLSGLTHVEVRANRVQIQMQKGDMALVFRLLNRLPEGSVFNIEILRQCQYELGLLSRLA